MHADRQKQNTRIRSVDIGRGIAMCCIVSAHVLRTGILADVLMCTGVAAFLILSGYVENYNTGIGKAAEKRIRRLYLPYLAVGLVSILLYRIFGTIASDTLSTIQGEAEYRIVPNIGYLLYANSKIHHSMKWNETLWFLPCFLVSLLLAWIPEKLTGYGIWKTERKEKSREGSGEIRREEPDRRIRGAARLFFSVLYYCAGAFLVSQNLHLPFQTETALHLAPFILLGHAMGDERRRSTENPENGEERRSRKEKEIPMEIAGLVLSVLCFTVTLLLMAYSGSPSVRTDEYPQGALSYLLVLMDAFFFVIVLQKGGILLSGRAENETSGEGRKSTKDRAEETAGQKSPSVLELIGRRSLGIMLWNKFPVVFLQLVLGKRGMTELFLGKSTPTAFLLGALLGLVCIALCMIFTGIPGWFRKLIKKS